MPGPTEHGMQRSRSVDVCGCDGVHRYRLRFALQLWSLSVWLGLRWLLRRLPMSANAWGCPCGGFTSSLFCNCRWNAKRDTLPLPDYVTHAQVCKRKNFYWLCII